MKLCTIYNYLLLERKGDSINRQINIISNKIVNDWMLHVQEKMEEMNVNWIQKKLNINKKIDAVLGYILYIRWLWNKRDAIERNIKNKKIGKKRGSEKVQAVEKELASLVKYKATVKVSKFTIPYIFEIKEQYTDSTRTEHRRFNEAIRAW